MKHAERNELDFAGIAFACASINTVEEIRQPQKRWVMSIVWPATPVYFGVFALWVFFARDRQMSKDAMQGLSPRRCVWDAR